MDVLALRVGVHVTVLPVVEKQGLSIAYVRIVVIERYQNEAASAVGCAFADNDLMRHGFRVGGSRHGGPGPVTLIFS